ncbi:methylenetetrahydrofolate reductase [Brevibacterium daeguense]|uniref:Methylenetetrahydrofolate reductase n=1 Tax=Brevibacterium daeguense TaxID=909936 RepID=A0ABP8EJL0_9MICO|nr:methylenetetrahydrofolate reductase [Brevibacterium daeguense]
MSPRRALSVRVLGDEHKEALAGLLGNVSYEVMPFRSAEEQVLAHVPTDIPLTATVTGGKGVEPTIRLATALAGQGYAIAPHLPARMVHDALELDEILSRLEDAGIDRLFVIGGDVDEQAGEFPDALSLLTAMRERGHAFSTLGIAGYPEGHAFVAADVMAAALRNKAPLATALLTQICFDADTVVRWAADVADDGIELPIHVGIPAPASRQKLVRISAGLGLGQSANFLRKQRSMLWRFFTPSGYDPTRLVVGLARALPGSATRISGLHVFTFNEFAGTESWRRDLLAQLS